MKNDPGLKICLAASGGGHLRQLLDLEPIWSEYDHFFVSESTALGLSIAERHRTHFVTHVAIGQARLGKPWLMITSALRNLKQAWQAIRAERPDVVISTGAGTVFFAVLLSRLFGAKLILIESFARFSRPSFFMRIVAPFASRKVVQSSKLAAWWPDAEVFDPLVTLSGTARPPKKPLLFATVGATLTFDRLVEAVAQLKQEGLIPERVIAQVGQGGVKPAGLDCVDSLTFEEMKATLEEADFVVCHGGTGSLVMSLREQCRTIAMPRLFSRGEVYDHHQEEIAEAFASRGLIGVAHDVDGLRRALQQVRATDPVCASTDHKALMEWLRSLLQMWASAR